MNLKKFKKVAEDKHTSTLKHADGHTITVVHSALSPDMQKQLKTLHLDNGGKIKGTVKDYDKGYNAGEDVGQSWQNVKDAVSSVFSSSPTPSPTPQNKAQGGQINPKLQEAKKVPGRASYADGTGDVSSSDVAPNDLSDVIPDSNSTAAPVAVPDNMKNLPTAPTVDPIVAQKRQIYNQIVAGGGDPAAQVNLKDSMFGPNGEEPSNFSPNAWNMANQSMDSQQKQKNAEAMQQAAHVESDNQARIAAGLKPIPVPDNMMKLAAAGATTSGLVSSQPDSGSQPQSSDDPMGQAAYMGSYDKAVGEQKAGIGAEAAALGQQGQAENKALDSQIQQQQNNVKSYQDNYNNLENERKGFQKDITDQHIDPNHYMNSMDTGKRISTGIGLILGGMGGGILGQENPALKMLQMHINNDIEAQKANLGKSENLLAANMHQFGNLRDASDMTRIMMNDMTSNKLKQAAAQAQTPLAAARAQQAIGQLDQQSAQVHQQMAMRQTMVGMASGLTDPNKAAQTAQMLRAYGNPEGAKALEEKIVPGVGVGQVPVPEAIRQNIVASKSVNDLMNRSLEFSRMHAGSMNPAVNAQASVIQNQLIGVIKQAQHDGVYKPSEADFLLKQIGGSPTSFLANMSSVPKIQELQKIKQQEYGETLKTYGIRGPGAQLPAARQPATGGPQEGATAINKQTGQKITFRNGKWI